MKATIRALAAATALLYLAAPGRAEEFVEWVQTPYNITLSQHFTGVNQARTDSVSLVLHHDVAVTVRVSEPEVAASRLRCEAAGSTDTLATSYKLSGARLTPSDSEWIDADLFVGRSYTLLPAPGEPYNSTIQLAVRAATATEEANDGGQYTATITVTATQID